MSSTFIQRPEHTGKYKNRSPLSPIIVCCSTASKHPRRNQQNFPLLICKLTQKPVHGNQSSSFSCVRISSISHSLTHTHTLCPTTSSFRTRDCADRYSGHTPRTMPLCGTPGRTRAWTPTCCLRTTPHTSAYDARSQTRRSASAAKDKLQDVSCSQL